ncbi:Exopolyphosphatase [hydrothermal vent metagenome]|uniref:Exopolyphosphatase n=1 Tax=hydrothermal vent metagenome TaxID=652676 RepID=A0A1W1CY80_9ZZZZ
MAKRVAVIDIGSNSVRMVIYEKTSRFAFHLLYEEKSKVRIAEDAYKNGGLLQEIPMQRTFDALGDFVQIADSFRVRKMLCVATSALRDAPNKQDFLHKVRDKLKLNIKVISGEKEAYFGAMACANLLPKQTNALSIDIGGGSTELAYINGNSISHIISLKLGTVRLKELYFDSNDIAGAIKYIDTQLQNIPNEKIERVIGIGGTFRALSNAILLQSNHPLNKLHAFEYSREVFENFLDKVLKSDTKELKNLSIEPNRFDVIKPGALILQRLLKKVAIQNIITSGVGVREGVYLHDLLRNAKDKFPHNYNTSVKYILDMHVQDKAFSNQLAHLSKQLFDLTAPYFEIPTQYRVNLALAAKLYPAGRSIHFYSQNKHTYYLIQTALEYGFSHKDIMLIATLTRYAKNKLPSNSHLKKYATLLPKQKTTKQLSFLLSLSIILLSHRPRNIDFSMHFENGTLFINSQNKLYLAKDGIEKLHCEHEKFKVVFQ